MGWGRLFTCAGDGRELVKVASQDFCTSDIQPTDKSTTTVLTKEAGTSSHWICEFQSVEGISFSFVSFENPEELVPEQKLILLQTPTGTPTILAARSNCSREAGESSCTNNDCRTLLSWLSDLLQLEDCPNAIAQQLIATVAQGKTWRKVVRISRGPNHNNVRSVKSTDACVRGDSATSYTRPTIIGSAAPHSFDWHDVEASVVQEPKGTRCCLKLVHRNINREKELEARMAELAEANLKLLSSCIPHSMLSVAANPSGAGMQLCKRYHCVTAMALRLVDLADLAQEAEAQAGMKVARQLFALTDKLCKVHKVHKVECLADRLVFTMGMFRPDSSGMLVEESRHDDPALWACRMMSFAKAVAVHAKQIRLPYTSKPISVRIGLHSGTLVAGLLGGTVPRFHFFGDALDIAMRMESTCKPGMVHMSAATNALLGKTERLVATRGVQIRQGNILHSYMWVPQITPSTSKEQVTLAANASTSTNTTISTNNNTSNGNGSSSSSSFSSTVPGSLSNRGSICRSNSFVPSKSKLARSSSHTPPGRSSSASMLGADLLAVNAEEMLKFAFASNTSASDEAHAAEWLNASWSVTARAKPAPWEDQSDEMGAVSGSSMCSIDAGLLSTAASVVMDGGLGGPLDMDTYWGSPGSPGKSGFSVLPISDPQMLSAGRVPRNPPSAVPAVTALPATDSLTGQAPIVSKASYGAAAGSSAGMDLVAVSASSNVHESCESTARLNGSNSVGTDCQDSKGSNVQGASSHSSSHSSAAQNLSLSLFLDGAAGNRPSGSSSGSSSKQLRNQLGCRLSLSWAPEPDTAARIIRKSAGRMAMEGTLEASAAATRPATAHVPASPREAKANANMAIFIADAAVGAPNHVAAPAGTPATGGHDQVRGAEREELSNPSMFDEEHSSNKESQLEDEPGFPKWLAHAAQASLALHAQQRSQQKSSSQFSTPDQSHSHSPTLNASPAPPSNPECRTNVAVAGSPEVLQGTGAKSRSNVPLSQQYGRDASNIAAAYRSCTGPPRPTSAATPKRQASSTSQVQLGDNIMAAAVNVYAMQRNNGRNRSNRDHSMHHSLGLMAQFSMQVLQQQQQQQQSRNRG